MNHVILEILLIALIFILGVVLSFKISILAGIGFVILANIALPTIIKFSNTKIYGLEKLQQR